MHLLLHFFRRFETQNVNAYIQNLQCQGNQRNERPQGRFILFCQNLFIVVEDVELVGNLVHIRTDDGGGIFFERFAKRVAEAAKRQAVPDVVVPDETAAAISGWRSLSLARMDFIRTMV